MSRREDWADPDARFAWDHDDPMEEAEDNRLPAVEGVNPVAMTMKEIMADKADYCPF